MEAHVERVVSRQDLVGLLRRLSADVRANPEEWENASVERYLESMAAWLEDMDGYFSGKGEEPPREPTWRLVGQVLLAAKYYE